MNLEDFLFVSGVSLALIGGTIFIAWIMHKIDGPPDKVWKPGEEDPHTGNIYVQHDPPQKKKSDT